MTNVNDQMIMITQQYDPLPWHSWSYGNLSGWGHPGGRTPPQRAVFFKENIFVYVNDILKHFISVKNYVINFDIVCYVARCDML